MATTVYRPASSSTGDSTITGDVSVTGDHSVTGNSTVTADVTVDTNTLHVDSANNRVGMGTILPEERLHLADTLGTTIRLESTTGATSAGNALGIIEWEGNDASGGANGIRGSITGEIQDNFGAMHLLFSLAANSSSIADVAELDYNGNLDLYGDHLRIRTAKTPSSASDTGSAGQIAWDTGFIYVCTATDAWERVAIASW